MRERDTKPRWKVLLHEAVQASPQLAAAWMLYATTKSFVRDGSYFELHPEARGRTSPFDEEVFARDAMAEFWAVQPDVVQASDAYLQLLARVRDAGFIAEYVWTFLRQADWTPPGDVTRFQEWLAGQGIRDHKALTLALLRPGEDQDVSSREGRSEAGSARARREFPVFGTRHAVPRRLAGLALDDVIEYPDPDHGVSLRYSASPHVKVDAYLYSDGLAVVPEDLTSTPFTDLFHDVWTGILRAAEQGRYLDLRVLEEPRHLRIPGDPKGRHCWWGRLSYRQAPGEGVGFTGVLVSELAMRSDRGYFNKVRYSRPQGPETQTGTPDCFGFLTAWTEALRVAPTGSGRPWWAFWR